MKKHIRVLVILSLVLCLGVGIFSLSGCTKGCRKFLKHKKSEYIGLKRKIYWYTETGVLFKTWGAGSMWRIWGTGLLLKMILKKRLRLPVV